MRLLYIKKLRNRNDVNEPPFGIIYNVIKDFYNPKSFFVTLSRKFLGKSMTKVPFLWLILFDIFYFKKWLKNHQQIKSLKFRHCLLNNNCSTKNLSKFHNSLGRWKMIFERHSKDKGRFPQLSELVILCEYLKNQSCYKDFFGRVIFVENIFVEVMRSNKV